MNNLQESQDFHYPFQSQFRLGLSHTLQDRWRLGALARQPIASSPRFRRADRACHFQPLRGARSWAAVAGATAAALGRSAAVRFSIGASDRFSVVAVRFGLNRRPLSIEAHAQCLYAVVRPRPTARGDGNPERLRARRTLDALCDHAAGRSLRCEACGRYSLEDVPLMEGGIDP